MQILLRERVLSCPVVTFSCWALFPFPEESDIVMDGGRKYRQIVLKPRENVTPGVRRSTRTRLPPVRPYDMLEYDYHSGKTPSKKLGEEHSY